MKESVLSVAAVIVLLLAADRSSAQECTIEESVRAIKTYPYSDPDPVPILVKRPAVYPYCAFNGFSSQAVDRDWKVVRLENDFIAVEVLPEAGGKILGAVEKSTGNEFIYRNSVMKFRQIALRGPWTSGGIEFNFGIIGHAPSTAGPVDYNVRENPDGSVSCVVGAMDLPSRTRWSVTITLHPGKAFVETNTLWYNPTPFNQSYYAWMNNAVAVGEDLQYFYPGRSSIPHSYDAPPQPWPVDPNGLDLSWYRNNAFGGDKSRFILGEYAEHFGGYWHDRDFGFGHWARYDDVPGKKIWIWALSRQGAIWENLLTDSDGQYSEPQAGRLYSQTDHELFAPHCGDAWREIWFPVKGTGGLADASPFGVLNVQREGRSLEIGICPLQDFEDDLVVTLAGENVLGERLDLKAMEPVTRTIGLPGEEGELRVRLGGTLAFSNAPGVNEIGRPIRFHHHDETTAEGLYLSGGFHERRRSYGPALEKYEACLEKEPLHTRALTRIAEIHGRRGEYDKGLAYAGRALESVMYDPEANYVYGLLSRRIGDLVNAKETFGWAARSLEFRSNAYCQIAAIGIVEGELEKAIEYAGRALEFNRYNLRAREILAIAGRRAGRPKRAAAALSELLSIDPLNHLARFERHLGDHSAGSLAAFKAMVRNELPHETYLETALSYVALGLEDDALALLDEAPEHPIVYYWIAYLQRNRSPALSDSRLERAGKQSPRLVFPFREETIPVLRWAAGKRAHDWKPRYYLGLVFWSKGRMEDARRAFASCEDVDFAPFYLALGHLDSANAVDHFKKALGADEGEWRAWHYLADRLIVLERTAEALDLLERALEQFPGEIVLCMDHARALHQAGRCGECLALLEKLEVLPYEGAWEAHDIFVRSHVRIAMDLMVKEEYAAALEHLEAGRKFPERLGTGRPLDPDLRLHDSLAALCRERLGDEEGAERIRRTVCAYTLRHWADRRNGNGLGLVVMNRLGEGAKAQELLKVLEARFPNDPALAWSRAVLAGKSEKAGAVAAEQRRNPRFQLMVEAAAIISSGSRQPSVPHPDR